MTSAPTQNQTMPPDEPEGHRMTIGEHLEDLRHRLLLGIKGFVVVAFACMALGKYVLVFFLRPLIRALAANNLNPQVYFHGVEETFVIYMKVSLITAAAISGPWIVYQLWKFVADGLYPRERKYITKYIPLSIALLLCGMVFLYTFVLPITLNFFLTFTIGMPLKFAGGPVTPAPTTQAGMVIASLAGDPAQPQPMQMWYNQAERRLKFFVNDQAQVIPLGSNTLTTPQIMLDDYINMVLNLLLSFGIAFQLPLVVMALERIGIVDIPTLKKWRRYVYFAMSVVAAFIIPDVVSGMVALMVPLIGLYELGILLASWGRQKKRAKDAGQAANAH